MKNVFILIFIAIGISKQVNATALARPPESDTSYKQELENFQFQKFIAKKPSCDSMYCHIVWASAIAALGDIGEYARRISNSELKVYAESLAIKQDFKALEGLKILPSSTPYHTDEIFKIKLNNFTSLRKKGRDGFDFSSEARPIITIKINGISTDAILDTGMSLTVPSSSAAAKTLKKYPVLTKSASALGDSANNMSAVASRVSIGEFELQNLFAKISGSDSGVEDNRNAFIGFDALFRFSRVNFDFANGYIEFNKKRNSNNCSLMNLIIDRNMLFIGIGTLVEIDGHPFKARIDTGANVDVLVHGSEILKEKPFSAIPNTWFIDASGKSSTLESTAVNVKIGLGKSRHIAFRANAPRDYFDITLGAKFFNGKKFSLDFENRQFCIN